MSLFQYAAKNSAGKIVKGLLVASNERDLGELLRNQQLTMMTAKPAVETKSGLAGALEKLQGVPVVQKIFFTQNLGVMLRGGFSISRAMGVLSQQTQHKYFKKVILLLQNELEGGTSFSQALKKFPRVFSDLFVNMVAAGEVSGKLDDVLKALTMQMKKDHQLISKVKGAMTYPVIVIIAMIGAGVAMMTFVIPKLLTIFQENHAQLPLPTRVLIFTSNLLTHQGIWLGLGAAALIAAVIWIGRTARGRWIYDTALLNTPIAGPIVKKINLARFMRSLSSMLATDIPIIQTFQIISRTLTSAHYRHSMDESAQALRAGTSIARVLSRYPKLYPPLVEQMINVGEESGTLDEVSGELADFFEEEVDQTMSNLSTIIEPALLLVLGVGVAGMAISILLPIYSLSDQIN